MLHGVRRALGAGLGCCAALALAAVAQGQVVISQVWGAGGFVANGPNRDLVELFNAGAAPVNLSAYSLQYRSGNSTTATWQVRALSGTIPARGYFLVALQPASATGTAVTPDLTLASQLDISVNRGQLALVLGTTALTASGCPAAGATVDFVGYGRGPSNDGSCDNTNPGTFCAACREGATVADNAPGGDANNVTVWIRRKCGGLTDTNNSFNDWEVVGPGPVNPSFPGLTTVDTAAAFRNASSPPNTGGVSITPSATPAPLSPNAISAAAPGSLVTFTVVAQSGCATVTSVTANLTALGGPASAPLTNQGNGQFAITTTVGAGVSPGLASVTFTASGGTQATLPFVVTQPNDECSAPAPLGTGTGSFAWSNAGATATFDDPANPGDTLPWGCGLVGGAVFNDAWYSWTAPATGTFTASTELSAPANFDARLVVWDGLACPPSASVGCGDNNFVYPSANLAAVVTFQAVGGQTYLFQIGSASEAQRTTGGVLRIAQGTPGGACCTPQNTCQVVADQASCDALGGRGFTFGTACTPPGPGTPDCSPLGACCIGSGGCVGVYTQTRCSVEAGFLSWTAGQTCSPRPCPPGGRCCSGTGACTNVVESLCGAGSVWSQGLTCATDPCPTSSICCRGATCAVLTGGACTLSGTTQAGAFSAGPGSACNAQGNTTGPCCKADYNKQGGVELLDIFAFLNDWFANVPYADFNGQSGVDLLDIFAFLTAWFAGGC
jgi:hypothetical protein